MKELEYLSSPILKFFEECLTTPLKFLNQPQNKGFVTESEGKADINL
jgi:hypothetical protein